MQTAAARILPEENEPGLTREAVLLEWERKIEEAERRPSRFERVEPSALAQGDRPRRRRRTAPPTEDATRDAPRSFEPAVPAPVAERRTITITGQPVPPRRRRRSVVESQLAQPDRVALWAFLLGLFLVAVAAGTAHA